MGRQTGGVTRSPVRGGSPRANVISPAGVSQIGTAVDPKAVERLQRGTGPAVPMGNAVATNVGAGGPGTGRTVYARGTNAVHGPVDRGEPRPQGTDILRQFGPDKKV